MTSITLKITNLNEKKSSFSSNRMVLTVNNEKNSFISQYLRDIDIGMILSKNDKIIVEVYAYPSNLNYNNIFSIDENSNVIYNNSIVKKLGKYNININIENEEYVFGIKKGYIKSIFDDCKIYFRTIYHDNIQKYEITHPSIEGNLEYLNKL
jgi:hypothetical protein